MNQLASLHVGSLKKGGYASILGRQAPSASFRRRWSREHASAPRPPTVAGIMVPSMPSPSSPATAHSHVMRSHNSQGPGDPHHGCDTSWDCRFPSINRPCIPTFATHACVTCQETSCSELNRAMSVQGSAFQTAEIPEELVFQLTNNDVLPGFFDNDRGRSCLYAPAAARASQLREVPLRHVATSCPPGRDAMADDCGSVSCCRLSLGPADRARQRVSCRHA